MTIVDGVRYRIEDAPKHATSPIPVDEPTPIQEVEQPVEDQPTESQDLTAEPDVAEADPDTKGKGGKVKGK